MSGTINVIAHVYVKAGKKNDIMSVMSELIEKTRAEAGCIRYDLFESEDNADNLTIIEEWKSRQALEEHFQTGHFIKLGEKIDNLSEKEADIFILNKVM